MYIFSAVVNLKLRLYRFNNTNNIELSETLVVCFPVGIE